MSTSATSHGDSYVSLDKDGVIVSELRGKQDRQTIEANYAAIEKLAKQQRAQGKPVLFYTDMSGWKMSDLNSGLRKDARKALDAIRPDKAALTGGGALVTFVMYLARASGFGDRVQFFKSKRQAYSWLTGNVNEDRPNASLIAGLLIIAVGVSALIGWQTHNEYLMSWIPSLRPINPVAAVGLIGAGIGTVCYWMGKLKLVRIAGIGAIALGVAALLPLHIDYILYGGRLTAMGDHVQLADSAAVCFIAMGIVGLIANRKGRWVHPLEYFAAFIMGSLAVLNVFGQLYAHDWLYGISGSFVMAFNLAAAFLFAVIALIISILYRQLGRNIVSSVTRIGWLIVIVLLLVQVVTYAAWQQSISRNEAMASSAFMRDARAIEDTLRDRFTAYINALYGFQGLFRSSTGVNEAEFRTYYQTTDITKQYPGLRALAFISKVSDKDLPAFIEQRRKDTSVNPAGNPNFTIMNRTNHDVHYIVTYIEAAPSGTAGNDLSANPARVKAFELAEKKQAPIASGTVEFAATPTSPTQTGFFFSIPVSYSTAPDKTIGVVNAAFNYQNFFKDTFSSAVPQDNLLIKMTDMSDGKVVYAANNTDGQKTELMYGVPLAVGDRTWNLQISAPAHYNVGQTNSPRLILIAGQVFSALLLVIFWLQARGRQQALNLADNITKDLQEERNNAVANDQKSTAILSSIGDGVFAVNVTGHIAVFNPAAQEISGYDLDEALGTPYDEVLHFEYARTGKVNDKFIRKALRGHVASMDSGTIIVRKDGKRVPVADSAAPIRDATGKIIGAIIVFRDISKEYELDKAKTEFVSLASHQLRTPLSAINWYSEMLLGGDAGKLNKEQHEYIKEIFEGSQRMVELVNSLLDVSRLEVGKLVDNPQPTRVQELVSAQHKELMVSIKDKHMKIALQVDDIPAVNADPKQLRMIVQNLMSNAVKYTPEKGEVTITLRNASAKDKHAADIKKSGSYWFFSVQDSGYGIPHDQQSKIFGKLFRADNVRKLNVDGTGLGLYIVKEVVEKMGGHVWFDSAESVGTTFFVVAPLDVTHARNDRTIKKKEKP